ncbi:MAG: cytochrome b5-like heme/steroid binding domain-containing protein [archaeon]|jgi:cytochrome b involved in lipid metabolism
MKKLIILLLVLTLLLFFGCTISVNPQDLAPSKNYSVVTNPTGSDLNNSSANVTKLALTVSEVAKHSTSKNCWMILNGNVYDLSTYVAHPGGSVYLNYCGTNATQNYNTKDGRGIMHSSFADTLLANYLVGALGQEIIVGNSQTPTGNSTNPGQGTLPDTNSSAGADTNYQTQVQVSLTLSEVAKHSVSGDCWMVINNSVYDLGQYVAHPGGSVYLNYCGTNATTGYDTKGGGGGAHSSYADALLSNYLIGTLGQTVIVDSNPSPNPVVPPNNKGDDEDEWDD